MAYEDVQKDILEDIKRVKEKIQEIYYLGQFDIANQFNSRLEETKQKLLQGRENIAYSVGIKGTILETIINEIVGLEYDIDRFLEEKGNMLREEQNRANYQNKTNKIISSISTRSTEELFADLTEIINKWNTYNHSEIERQIGEERIAKVVLKIFEGQAQKGETIDISVVRNYCSPDIFLDTIRQKLIRIAQKQNKDDANETLEKARFLKQEDLSEPNLWRTITSIENIAIATKDNLQATDIEDEKELQNIEPEQEKNEIKAVGESTAIEILNSQPSKLKQLISKVKDIAIGSTIYTLADIDEDTGECTNVRKVFDKFPPKRLSYEDSKKVREIEIRNKQTITNEEIESLIERYNNEGNRFRIFPNMKILIIGEGVEILGKGVFQKLHNLENVIIGDTVKEIGNYAFSDCYNLKKVSFGRNIKKIGENVFFRCLRLSEVNIPSSIKEWGKKAFQYCQELENVRIEEGVQEIGDSFFEDTGIKNILLPNSLKKIGTAAFKGSYLKEIIIPNGVEEIGLGAFSKCKKLEKLHLGSSIKELPESCFADCIWLEDIHLNKNLQSINYHAFGNCRLLEQITFGENIKHIGDSAFANCSLESVSIPKSVVYLASNAFSKNPLRDINLEKGIQKLGFQEIQIDDIEIPNSVNEILSFKDSTIKHIKINGLPQINSEAFEGSNIDTIEMQGNSEFINDLAFSKFNSMQQAVIEGKTYKFIQGIFQNRRNKEQYKFAVLTPEALKKLRKTLESKDCEIISTEYPGDTEGYKPMKPIHEEAKEERRNKPDAPPVGDGYER